MNAGTLVECLAILFTAATLMLASWLGYGHLWRRFVALFVAVLAFEVMCDPLWQTTLPHRWVFLFGDISWVMILWYGSLYGITMLVVDNGYRELGEHQRFWLYLLFLLGLWIPIDSVLISTGVRTYPPLMTQTFLSGAHIPLTSLPIEEVFAVPVFSMLLLGFYRYVRRVWVLEDARGAAKKSVGARDSQVSMRGVAEVFVNLGLLITLLAGGQLVWTTWGARTSTELTLHHLLEVGFYIALPLALLWWKLSLRSKVLPQH